MLLCSTMNTASEAIAIIGGTAHPVLAAAVARELGLGLVPSVIERFPDGEVSVVLGESMRKREVVLIQPTCPPVDPHLIELLALADACRRDGAKRITAVIPYFGYSRGDKRQGRHMPLMGRLVADLLQSTGIDHVLTVDAHSAQLEGFFHQQMDSLRAAPALCAVLRGHLPPNVVVVAPDAGRVAMASEYAQHLDTTVAIFHKERLSGSETRVVQLIGDVRDRPCLLIDDMIATGSTIVNAAVALREAGALPGIIVATVHGLLVGDARARLAHSGVSEVIVTDSVPVAPDGELSIRTVSIAPLLATAIRRSLDGGSLQDLC